MTRSSHVLYWRVLTMTMGLWAKDSSVQEVKLFYEQLEKAIRVAQRKEIFAVIGDSNVNIDSDSYRDPRAKKPPESQRTFSTSATAEGHEERQVELS